MRLRQFSSWMVHFFTAIGGVLGLMAVQAAFDHDYIPFFWILGAAIVIDGLDGTFARIFEVKKIIPQFDGALLDNIIDFITYSFAPACFILNTDLVPWEFRFFAAALIVLVSAYQFCHVEAKTSDNFFTGFPSYWNILVFYLFVFSFGQWVNLAIIGILAILVFIPIKYVYPSQLTFLEKKPKYKWGMIVATAIWFVVTFGMLYTYPDMPVLFIAISLIYVAIYLIVSVLVNMKVIK